MKKTNRNVFEGGHLNTLAQSGTVPMKLKRPQPLIVVSGEGSDLNKTNALLGRAKRKVITQKMMLSQIDVAKKTEAFDWVQSFWNSYHCQNWIISSEGRYYGTYCKNRFCTICLSIRKAYIVNTYLPIIKEWEDPHFSTLTIRAVPAHKLNSRIDGMFRAFKILKGRMKKRSQRNKGSKFIGIKSLECNYNPILKTYNPHFHFILANKEIAEMLEKEWLKLWTPKFALKCAQKTERVGNKESALLEVVKYGSKIFTEPDLKNKSGNKVSPFIYSKALNTILMAMKGHRIFERFGFNTGQLKKDTLKTTLLTKYDVWKYCSKTADWVNEGDKQKVLASYTIPIELENLLRYNINNEIN